MKILLYMVHSEMIGIEEASLHLPEIAVYGQAFFFSFLEFGSINSF